ncbi:murein hydrolase activator EnvC [Emticicia sp. C21]|uniref:murein hydrolase activator EnvC family protein n=1 Tax=Emticicia sp. C21 TaxID=2302915 RepID=UPI000E34D23E|nr:peptidoglycan DD-metalloendopeptidase family protein [Emticicia sp. C21]RFS17307.1 peptidase M23 [Emticicia sp. C21]
MSLKSLTYFFLTCFLFGLLINQQAFAQRTRKSRSQLENEKKRNLEKIAETTRALESATAKKEVTVGNIKAIKEQISSREEQIGLMEQDMELIDVEMQDIVSAKENLEDKLIKLKEEYAAMLYSASKYSGKLNKLSFLFSSSSFNELLMRYKYLQQYTENRKAQVTQMNKVAALLYERQTNLEGKRTAKNRLITAKVVETKNLEQLKTKQTEMVGELSKKETDLRKEIEATKRSVTKLDNLIANVVAREIAKKNKERERKQDKEAKLAKTNPTRKRSNKPIMDLDMEETTLGRSFGASRARLPWPVQRGFISDRFGVKEHPVLHGVLINNNGIDIQTPSNATVRSVYDGIVKDITEIPGLGRVVAVQHGDYFTVYANLNQVFASVGQKISAKETIGTAGVSGGATEINFQIWHNTERLNPENWLVPR